MSANLIWALVGGAVVSVSWAYAFYAASNWKPVSDEEICEIDDLI